MRKLLTKKFLLLTVGFVLLLALPFTIIHKATPPRATSDMLNPYKEPKDPAEAFIHRASDNYFYHEFDKGAENYRKAIAIYEERQDWKIRGA